MIFEIREVDLFIEGLLHYLLDYLIDDQVTASGGPLRSVSRKFRNCQVVKVGGAHILDSEWFLWN